MESPIVTLTTDWGNRDFFAGMVKGRLYSAIPNVRVVDITHGIEPFQPAKAIFVVKNACLGFPKGTIHIIDVNSTESSEHPFVIIEYHGQYYICTDNGLPFAVFGSDYSRAVVINTFQESEFFTFAAYHLFCAVAIRLAQGADLSEFGPATDTLCTSQPFSPVVQNDKLKIYVTYVDAYGNADLNITYEEFERIRNGRKFALYIHENSVHEICHSYFDVDSQGGHSSSLLLTVSATGNLQIALREASAEQYLDLHWMDTVYVHFFN